ncbi:hypothetical protein LB543_25335 [Mesorhizobium sp. ESP7-2]|nr:hypothetical protein [Mesorhizobium sp. ESP7-2]
MKHIKHLTEIIRSFTRYPKDCFGNVCKEASNIIFA